MVASCAERHNWQANSYAHASTTGGTQHWDSVGAGAHRKRKETAYKTGCMLLGRPHPSLGVVGAAAHRWTALTVLCNNQPATKAPVKSCACVCSGRGTVCVVWPLVPVTMLFNGNQVDCWSTALQLGALQFLMPLVRQTKWTMGKQHRSFSVHKRQAQLSLAQIQNAGLSSWISTGAPFLSWKQ